MDASEEGEVRAGTCFCNLFILLGNVAGLKPENLYQPTGVGEQWKGGREHFRKGTSKKQCSMWDPVYASFEKTKGYSSDFL